MRIVNNFTRVCLSVCLSIQTIAFEPLKLGLYCQYADTSWTYPGQVWVSKSSGQGQDHIKNWNIFPVTSAFISLKFPRSRSSELQGYSVSGPSERKSMFCLFVNVFVISVLCRWYTFDWKAFLLRSEIQNI